MAYSAEILADSISPQEIRLTTFQVTYPRMVHAELMTHRVFSRNSASSRAIPVHKMHETIENDPVLPVWWGKNQQGMQAREELDDTTPSEFWDLSTFEVPNNFEKITPKDKARRLWLEARDNALRLGKWMDDLGLHKQIANRITEPWMWITVLVSATEWDNWWNLRCHPDAQPEIRHIAEMMADLYFIHSQPKELKEGEWHLPLWGFDRDKDYSMDQVYPVDTQEDGRIYFPEPVLISVGRCARVSYLTHQGERDPEADIELAVDRLIHPLQPEDPGHWSPWEHVATPFTEDRWEDVSWLQKSIWEDHRFGSSEMDKREMMRNLEFSGNFRGWTQARKHFSNESGTRWHPVSIH